MKKGSKLALLIGIIAAVAAVVVTAGLGTFCTGATAVPAKRKEETVQ